MSRRFSGAPQATAAAWSFNTANSWSVCGWVYLVSVDTGGGDVFFSVPNPGDPSINAIRLGYDVGPVLRFRTGNGVSALNLSPATALGAWHHMALTYDGTTARAYVDGSQVGSLAVAMTATHTAVDIGDFSSGGGVVEVAQVKVWNGHCLSVPQLAQEIAYWTPQSGLASIVSWWALENVAPTLDSSGNSHTLSVGGNTGLVTVPGAATSIINGSCGLQTTSRVTASGTSSASLFFPPVWVSDEPNSAYSPHSAWSSNPSA